MKVMRSLGWDEAWALRRRVLSGIVNRKRLGAQREEWGTGALQLAKEETAALMVLALLRQN